MEVKMRNYGRVKVVDGKLSKSAWLIYAVVCIVMGFLVFLMRKNLREALTMCL